MLHRHPRMKSHHQKEVRRVVVQMKLASSDSGSDSAWVFASCWKNRDSAGKSERCVRSTEGPVELEEGREEQDSCATVASGEVRWAGSIGFLVGMLQLWVKFRW